MTEIVPQHFKFQSSATLNSKSLKSNNSKKKKHGTFVCPYQNCNTIFPTQFSLKRHLKRHTGDKPFQCTYINPITKVACEKKFAEKSTLKRHLQAHSGDKPFKCSIPDCDKMFADRVNLSRHELSHQTISV